MIGYVLSLSLMVALANLPIGTNLPGSGSGLQYAAFGSHPDEPLTMITVQDLARNDEAPAREKEVVPSSPERRVAAGKDEAPDRRTYASPAAVLRPATAGTPGGLPSMERTRKLLRYTSGPPSIDDPPKVRTGSMIVRYPLSAIKKAIEGLVIVRFTVEPSGKASGVEVVKGLDPACDVEVVEAVERARFHPGKSKGREVPAYSQMTVRFVLAEAGSGIAY